MGLGLRNRFGVFSAVLLAAVLMASRAHAADSPDWGKQCEKAADGKEICYVMQTAIVKPQNIRLLQVIVGYLGKNGAPTMILTTPLGVLVSAGMSIKIDDKKELTVPFETCLQNGCRVVLAMDSSGFEGIKASKEAKVRYLTVDNRPVDVPVKLDGLSKALKALKK